MASDSAAPSILLQERLLLGRGHPTKRSVPMREFAEACDDRMVMLRPSIIVGPLHPGLKQPNLEVLIFQ